jgi:hypothetical protein
MSENPVVKLAGKTYSVPQLVPRQLRVVLPALARIRALAPKDKGGEGAVLTTALYDDMILVLYWGAVWPNDKKADVGCLLDVPVTQPEMWSAITVISNQTGTLVPAPEGGAQPGEEISGQ